MLGSWFGHLIGRRWAYFALCSSSLLACSFLFSQVHEYGMTFLVLVGFAGGLTAAFYGWLPLYLPELFPTRARATGQGLAFNLGRILAALGAWQIGELMKFFHKSYAYAGVAITLVYLFGMLLIWFAPETKGKPLPE
jgi:MFS family permease